MNALVKRMAASLKGRKMIIGVDRLDYSKGIDQRMLAYERYLENHPEAQGEIVYLQVTPKSRSEVPQYADMQREIAETAGRINGAFSDLDWVPIRYVNRTIKRTTLAGLYRLAEVGLVTPMRDGMNLVAKEFVAAQDPQDPGVLVLSRFAGAARELDAALLVNPYDLDSTAAAIANSVSMPLDERRRRVSQSTTMVLRPCCVALTAAHTAAVVAPSAGRAATNDTTLLLFSACCKSRNAVENDEAG
jgi:trehalose 6-phosphate synthase